MSRALADTQNSSGKLKERVGVGSDKQMFGNEWQIRHGEARLLEAEPQGTDIMAATNRSAEQSDTKMKNLLTALAVAGMALFCVAVALPVRAAVAQEKVRVSFTVPAEDAIYTQQHILTVPDSTGHQLRVVEIHRVFPRNPPVMGGVALKELWVRAITDYVNENGRGFTYSEYVFENGDKFFAEATLVAHGTGSGMLQANTIGEITRGTGKFAGIEGHIFTTTFARPIAGNVETTFDIEYTIK